MKHFLLGTAGHVDHGKTSLIRALTEVETDRLPEEKARGLSIDLGFAPLALDGGPGVEGIELGIIDVPGHQRFLTNMIAGVGGLDGVMLVVDPNEGVKPQTAEHLTILELLGTPRGVVILSKADRADEETLEIARWELSERLQGTFLHGAPILATSTETGQGIPELKTALHRLFESVPGRLPSGLARLPIDRVFTKTGFGTVVTGSLWSGRLQEGAELEVAPLGLRARVRGLQVHGHAVSEALAGQRVAVNLTGVERAELHRGAQLFSPPGQVPNVTLYGAQFQLTELDEKLLRKRFRATFYQGTGHHKVQVQLLPDPERPSQAFGQICFLQANCLVRGDAFLLRDETEQRLLAGGRILGPDGRPLRRREQSSWLRRYRTLDGGGELAGLLTALKEAGGPQKEALLRKRAGLSEQAWGQLQDAIEGSDQIRRLAGGSYWHSELYDPLAARLFDLLRRLHEEASWKPGWRREELQKLLPLTPSAAKGLGELLEDQVEQGLLERNQAQYRLTGFQPKLKPAAQRAADRLIELLEGDGVSPRDWAQALASATGGDTKMADQIEQHLLGTEQLIRLNEKQVFAPKALQAARGRLVQSAHGRAFSTSEARQWLETSRKYIIPLLEWMDSAGWTDRQGDERTIRQVD